MNLKLAVALKKHFAETREPQYLIEKNLGFSEATISRLVNEQRKGSPETRQALAKYLGCKVKDIFEDEVSKN